MWKEITVRHPIFQKHKVTANKIKPGINLTLNVARTLEKPKNENRLVSDKSKFLHLVMHQPRKLEHHWSYI